MRVLALSILAGVLACSSSIAAEALRDDAYLTGEYRLDGYWLLSGKWMGDMGIALKIDKNRFNYWFYSDAKSDHEPTYPFSGEVEIKKNTVHLKYRGPEHLYSDKWHLIIYKNQICLLADSHYQDYMKTDKLDDSRLLFKVKEEDILDKKKPQMNAPVRISKPDIGATTTLSEKEVVAFANREAQRTGRNLADYESPRVEYEYTRHNKTWTVLYDGKVKAPGNFFQVWVNDETKKCTLMPGE